MHTHPVCNRCLKVECVGKLRILSPFTVTSPIPSPHRVHRSNESGLHWIKGKNFPISRMAKTGHSSPWDVTKALGTITARLANYTQSHHLSSQLRSAQACSRSLSHELARQDRFETPPFVSLSSISTTLASNQWTDWHPNLLTLLTYSEREVSLHHCPSWYDEWHKLHYKWALHNELAVNQHP